MLGVMIECRTLASSMQRYPLCISTGLLLGLLPGVLAADSVWPAVRPLHEQRTFQTTDNSDAPLTAVIRDTKGFPVYELECHNGDYDNGTGFNFSGTFHCTLWALSKGGVRESWNLLATDEDAEQTSDWFNRGRMTGGQLWGECGKNPDYGMIRRFRLRGMAIQFRYSDLRWFNPSADEHQLRAFKFALSVVADATAETPRAERVKTPRPPNSCW
jgi:hypothetical protein